MHDLPGYNLFNLVSHVLACMKAVSETAEHDLIDTDRQGLLSPSQDTAFLGSEIFITHTHQLICINRILGHLIAIGGPILLTHRCDGPTRHVVLRGETAKSAEMVLMDKAIID